MTVCLPCVLAKRLHEDGPHDCNETLAVLNESGAGFDMVACGCARPGDHPQKTETKEGQRGCTPGQGGQEEDRVRRVGGDSAEVADGGTDA